MTLSLQENISYPHFHLDGKWTQKGFAAFDSGIRKFKIRAKVRYLREEKRRKKPKTSLMMRFGASLALFESVFPAPVVWLWEQLDLKSHQEMGYNPGSS